MFDYSNKKKKLHLANIILMLSKLDIWLFKNFLLSFIGQK